MKKEVGFAIKVRKQVANQLEPVRNSCVTIMHQPVTVGSDSCNQIYIQIKHFLAYLQDLIPTLAA